MHRPLLPLAAAGILLIAAGCASEAHVLRNAADSYATTVELLAEYREAGQIDDRQAAVIEANRRVAREALDGWRASYETGGECATPRAVFRRALGVLIQILLMVEEDMLDDS